MAGSGGATSGDAIAVAHARLLADRSFQFAWSGAPKPAPPPSWLVAVIRVIGHALRVAAPMVRIGLWVVLALGAVAVVVAVVRQFLITPGPVKATPLLTLHGLGASASDAAARAAARLAEADRLAADGLYAEAAHMLLLRGVADVENGRPGRIRPSFTSRDIAALPDLPPEPRSAFALIAQVVERALFGARPIDAEAWRACREAYGALVRPEAWTNAAVATAA